MGANLFLLRELLLSLFEPEELRMFVHLRVDESLLHCLPAEGVSPAILAYRACVAFEKRGYLDAEFFALLVEERPQREADIRQAEQVFLSAPVSVRVVTEVQIRNLEKTLEHLDRCLERIKAGERAERAWQAVALLLAGVTAYLLWKHYFSDQAPEDIASDPEAQERLMAEAEAASAHGRAYLEVTAALRPEDETRGR